MKLAAPPAFVMPDLAAAADGLRVTRLAPERMTTTYFDTDDLRLARAGASFRFRTEEGWTVKLPGSSVRGVLRRPELNFPGRLGDHALRGGLPRSRHYPHGTIEARGTPPDGPDALHRRGRAG